MSCRHRRLSSWTGWKGTWSLSLKPAACIRAPTALPSTVPAEPSSRGQPVNLPPCAPACFGQPTVRWDLCSQSVAWCVCGSPNAGLLRGRTSPTRPHSTWNNKWSWDAVGRDGRPATHGGCRGQPLSSPRRAWGGPRSGRAARPPPATQTCKANGRAPTVV